jgi:hypothetical protein
VKKWEYMVVEAPNRLGQEGWEAVGSSFAHLDGQGRLMGVLLKREVVT